MAGLVLGTIGASIGGSIGGTFLGMSASSIGWAVGSTLGSLLFQPDGPDTHGPRLSDLSIQTATRGASVPKVYGTARIAGNVIWSAGIKETSHTQSTGGKGGGGGSSTTYTYSCSFALGLTEGPITGIRRIWADSVLIYNKGDGATADELAVSNQLGITIYTGSEMQEPDPLMEADKGIGNVPAYRGLAYVVFEDLQLEKYGNRIPNITCEVVEEGTGTYKGSDTTVAIDRPLVQVMLAYDVDVAENTVYWKMANRNGIVYSINPYEYRFTYNLSGTSKLSQDYVEYTADTFDQYYVYWMADTILVNQNIEITSGTYYDSIYSGKHRHVLGVSRHLSNIPIKHADLSYLETTSNSPLNGETDGYYLYVRQSDYVEQNHEATLYKLALPSSSTYDPVIKAELTMGGDIHDISINSGYVYVITHPGDGETGFTIHKLTSNLSIVKSLVTYGRHPRCQMIVDGNVAVVTSRTSPYYAVYDISEGVAVVLESGNSGDPTWSFSGGKASNMLLATHNWINSRPVQIGSTSVNLSSIVSRLCSNVGINSVDTYTVTSTLKGYVRTNQMTVRAALDPLLSAYNITAVESDYTLKFTPKSGVFLDTVLNSDLAATESETPLQDRLRVTRIKDIELPKRLTVAYTSEERNYDPGIQYSQRQVKDNG